MPSLSRTALLAVVAVTFALPLAAQPSFGAGARAIRSGETLTGTLTPSDPTLDDGSHYDLYLYDGTPGETLVLTLRSTDFDAFLIGGALGANGIDDTVTDDDGAGGTDAQLTIEIGATGRAAIQANSLSAGATGRYTIYAESLGGGSGGIVRAGDTVRGRLDTSDPTLDDGSHYDDYTIGGSPGEQVAVTMRSTAFDTFLQGGSLAGGQLQVEVSDDDGAGGTDSQLVLTIGADGTAGVRANSLEGGQTGDYTLTVEGLVGPTPGPTASATPIRAGDSVRGSLASGDGTLPDNSFYDLYEYQGQPNESIEVFMASADFDTFLMGGATSADAFAASTTDDDGGGGTNSQLRVMTGPDGRYTIIANAYSADARGDYQLTVRSAGGGQRELPGATALRLNQTVTGQLATSDPTLDDGSYFDFYTYEGRPGEDIVITLLSDDFDTYVMLNRVFGGEFESIANDDDSGPGTNARIRATLDQGGTYVIVVNSYAAGATGMYSLVVERPDAVADAAEAESDAPLLTTGGSTSGRLGPGDSVLADDSFADLYLYRGTPGETVAVTMRSSDFNAYLTVGTLEGGELAIVGRDDDSAGGTDARIQFTVGAGGLYAVQANSLRGGETGAYTVGIERVAVADGGEGGRTPRGRPEGPTTQGSSRFAGKWVLGGYNESEHYGEALEPFRQFVSDGGYLERTAEALNNGFPLPRNLPISFEECSDPNDPDRAWPWVNAYYSPRDGAVTFCYEMIRDMVAYFANTRPEDQVLPAIVGAYDFIMLHEAGHALRHQLDLPITGLEEDVVDQFATLMLLQESDKGVMAALNGVEYLNALGAIDPDMELTEEQQAQLNRYLYADEHSLGPQRLFNVQCWIFGSNPDKYMGLIVDEQGNERQDENALTIARAGRCPGEYEQMVKSFSRLLELVYNE